MLAFEREVFKEYLMSDDIFETLILLTAMLSLSEIINVRIGLV